MPIDNGNLALKGLDDLFSTEENRQEEQREQVQQIPIGELFPFKNHPFKVLDDESMQRTVESVERELIIDTLNYCLGNRTHAANILGISIRTLRNKLKIYLDTGS